MGLTIHLDYAVQQHVLRHFHRDESDILCQAFVGWNDLCRYVRAIWRCRIAAVSRRVHRLAHRAMQALQQYAGNKRQQKLDAIHALLRAAESVQRAGLRAWVEWNRMRCAKAFDLKRALQHRASALVRVMQRHWLAASLAIAGERENKHAQVGALALRRAHNLTRAVFAVWESEIVGRSRMVAAFQVMVQIRHAKQLYNKVLCKLARNIQHASFKTANAELADRCANAAQLRKRSTTLRIWRDAAWDAQQLAMAVAHVHERVREQQLWRQLARYILNRNPETPNSNHQTPKPKP